MTAADPAGDDELDDFDFEMPPPKHETVMRVDHDEHGSVGLDRSTHELRATCRCGEFEVFAIGDDAAARAWWDEHHDAHLRPPSTAEVRAWVLHNFGSEQTSAQHTIGIAEEVGELCRAVLKRDQGIRGTREEWTSEIRKELGDVVIMAHDIAAHEGFDLDEIVAERWAQVLRRDWRADPFGHGIGGAS